MLTGAPDVSLKNQPALKAFVERSSGYLAGIRNGILIFGQNHGSSEDLDVSIRNLRSLRADAAETDDAELVCLASECEDYLRGLSSMDARARSNGIGRSLDLVALIEKHLLEIPLGTDEFPPDISEFIDSSFRSLRSDEPWTVAEMKEEFEVDEETLEIFRSEASELIRNIHLSIDALESSGDDREALWEIRRNAHTFKGAAGIVGFRGASEIAHRIEDLLDKMVESNITTQTNVLELLTRSTKRLDRMVFGFEDKDDRPLGELHAEFDSIIGAVSSGIQEQKPNTPPIPANAAARGTSVDTIKPASTPMVRVSLDRLDDLIKLARSLAINRSAIVERFAQLADTVPGPEFSEVFEKLAVLFDAQRNLNTELQDKLAGIRMVRFGTLETRLTRAVHVTCQEENKKASLTLDNGDCEVDTQVIDAIIEPLLHLLKNAVVHGIEDEDTRRLIGKPEKGLIRIIIESDGTCVRLTVQDDGRGISSSKLVEKAIRTGILTQDDAEVLSENDAMDLIFSRGLTTAETLNLNAGRGVGMSIVKESVESLGGSVTVTSEVQKGTRFTIEFPAVLPKADIKHRPSVEPTTTISPNEEKKLVLIIDDSPSIRRQTSKLVEEAGFQIITAQNGAEALELLLSDVWRPDLILSDIEMPVMDGWQFLEYVKTDEFFGNIPIVMVTSLEADEHRKRASDLGASAYETKPVKKDQLIETILKQLEAANS